MGRNKFNNEEKWSSNDIASILAYISNSKGFEKPNVESYYTKLSQFLNFSKPWYEVQTKMRNLKQQYMQANCWGRKAFKHLKDNKEALRNARAKVFTMCPFFLELHSIYGHDKSKIPFILVDDNNESKIESPKENCDNIGDIEPLEPTLKETHYEESTKLPSVFSPKTNGPYSKEFLEMLKKLKNKITANESINETLSEGTVTKQSNAKIETPRTSDTNVVKILTKKTSNTSFTTETDKYNAALEASSLDILPPKKRTSKRYRKLIDRLETLRYELKTEKLEFHNKKLQAQLRLENLKLKLKEKEYFANLESQRQYFELRKKEIKSKEKIALMEIQAKYGCTCSEFGIDFKDDA